LGIIVSDTITARFFFVKPENDFVFFNHVKLLSDHGFHVFRVRTKAFYLVEQGLVFFGQLVYPLIVGLTFLIGTVEVDKALITEPQPCHKENYEANDD